MPSSSSLPSHPALPVALMLAWMLGACATGTDRDGDVAGAVPIGPARSMYIECRGSGTPTVILIAGQRGSAAEWSLTESKDVPPAPPVFAAVASFTRVCAYDRPGTPVGENFSRSDPAPQPTSAAAAVTDLHALLQSARQAGPYVLVGHSAGGAVARLFASTYPDEVRGMVLVDALGEGLQDALTTAQWPTQRLLLEGDLTESLREYPAIERFDADATFAQLRSAPRLRPLPLAVLSSDTSIGDLVRDLSARGELPAGVPADFGDATDRAQKRSQATLAALVPGARHVSDTHSGHNIHREQPQLVVAAIREVTDAVRQGRVTLVPGQP